MLVQVNGRSVFTQRVETITKLKPGRYTLETTLGTWNVEGGCHAGGAHNEWFLWQGNERAIYCTSLVDAITQIDKM